MAQRQVTQPLQIPDNTPLRLGIVQAEFNSDITNAQRDAALAFCAEYGIASDVLTVAGCYEIPYVLAHLATTQRYQALVAIGCLIEGETAHFDVIASSVATAIHEVVLQHHIPVGFGIITAHTQEQALARTHIGYDAAHAATRSFLATQS